MIAYIECRAHSIICCNLLGPCGPTRRGFLWGVLNRVPVPCSVLEPAQQSVLQAIVKCQKRKSFIIPLHTYDKVYESAVM